MEAIAVTASISALVGITAQSVKLIIKLSNIWKSLLHAPAEIGYLIQSLKLLEEVLQHTETIAVKYGGLNASPVSTVTSLHQELDLCHDQLVEWLEETEDLRPSDVQRPHRWMKKLKAVSHKARIHQVGEKVRSNLGRITLLVNILSGDLGIQGSRDVDELCTRIQDLQAKQCETGTKQMSQLEAIRAGVDVMQKQGFESKERERRIQISRWVSAVPYADHHALIESTRLPGTGQWLLDHPDFKDWGLNKYSEILWLSGAPGAGKTHLLSLVIDKLWTKYPNATAYFYCSYGDDERCSSISVLRSFLRQLYLLIVGPNPVATLYEQREKNGFNRENLTMREIVDLIKQMLRLKGLETRTFLALDGLDECDLSSRIQILRALQDIVSDANIWVKIIIGSRNNTEIDQNLDGCRHINLQSFDTLPDIIAFVHHELENCVSEKRLLRGQVSDTLRSRIESALVNGSDGMFLWVRLQIDRICEAKQAEDLVLALQELPHGLGDIYNNILQRIMLQRPRDVLLAKRALQWILYSAYPLSAHTLAKAVSLNLDSGTHDTIDVSLILDACQNLVVHDQYTGDIYLVHATARTFLNEKLDANEAHAYIAKVCIAALQGSSYTAEAAVLERNDFNDYASLNWPLHSSCARTSRADLAYREYMFMTNLQRHDMWIRYLSLYHIRPQSFDFGPQYNYFHVLVHRHCKSSISVDPLISASYFNLVGMTTALIKNNVKTPGVLSNIRRALHVAVERGHHIIVALLLQSKLVEPDSRTGMNISPLHRAAYMGHEKIVAMLLGSGRVNVNAANARGITALLFAINIKNEDLVMLLLEVPSIEVSQEGYIGPNTALNALTLSSARGSIAIVKRLLRKKGANVNHQSSTGETCLHYAASNNHGDIIRYLLMQSDIHTNAKDINGSTALHHASLHGCSSSVKELLKSPHIDPNLVDNCHRPPLLIALECRHLEVMARLLSNEKTDVNVVDQMGNSPLILAAARQYITDTKLLLSNKQTLINARNAHGTTALHWAINNQNNDLTRLLLNHAHRDLDINVQNNKGSAPLMLAASWGSSQIVNWLLEMPTIVVNQTDAKGYTSLDWALKHSKNECVMALKAHGAEESGKLMDDSSSDYDSESMSESGSVSESYMDIESGGDIDEDSVVAVESETTALEYLKRAAVS